MAMWEPKLRDYAAEAVARACATSVPERHPLQEAVERLEAIQKKEEEAAKLPPYYYYYYYYC